MRIRLLSLATISLLFLAACGHKGPVRPLEVSLPEAIQAPELRQQGAALLLGWELPTSNRDGSPLLQPVVDIYRMSYDPQDQCPECFDRSVLMVSINPQLPAPARQIGKRFQLRDLPLQTGTGYQYTLIVRNSDREQSQPVILRQVYADPVPAPQQVTAVPLDRSVRLSWQAPPLAPGDKLLGYLIYRRKDETDSPYPLFSKPHPEEQYEDFSLENGARYRYQIRALVERNRQQLEGIASPELSVTPQAGR